MKKIQKIVNIYKKSLAKIVLVVYHKYIKSLSLKEILK